MHLTHAIVEGQTAKRMRHSLTLFVAGSLIACLPCLAQTPLNPLPTRVIGQDNLNVTNLAPNLVEGREFNAPLSVALDTSANPPHLYVADTENNRVLGWLNASSFSNGQKADIVVGQLDLVTTFAQGPNRGTGSRTTGLATPVGLAVDANGNLYVADCANNRVLRFPKPFSQSTILPDMVIGQADFSHNAANGATGVIGPATLLLNPGSPFAAYLAIDSSGNLWVADAGNNRVLRFNASALSNGASGPAADLVLGQMDFVSGGFNGYTPTSLTQLHVPTGLAFDTLGNFFVSESNGQPGRVLVFNHPGANGQGAARLVGEPGPVPTTPVNALQLSGNTAGLAVVNNGLAIADGGYNRILLYAPVNQWTSDMSSQHPIAVLGQNDYVSSVANQGLPESSATTLSAPSGIAFSGTELFIADASNYRVVVDPLNGTTFGPATRVLGQDAMNFNTVNLIEGREVRFTTSPNGNSAADAGIVVDLKSTPPHLYIADTYNNRVLGYNDLRAVRPGSKADIVIGQPDFSHSELNFPSNNAAMPNQSGLVAPIGLAVDVNGNLYVADSGNSRVLRFPQPFANPQNLPNADIVIGQPSFTLKITDASPSTMNSPYGLAFANDEGLLVSDSVHNRVLFFAGASSGFTSGMAAAKVFGQPDFSTISSGNGPDKFNSPRHIATDSNNGLYVADTGNQRISIFVNAPGAASDPQAALSLTGVAPNGIYVNQTNGEIWVGNSTGTVFHYPTYDALTLGNLQPDTLSLNESSGVLAVTQDAGGALYVADGLNRVVIHYPGVAGINAANYITSLALAPQTIASLFTLSSQANYFTSSPTSATTLPIPTTLADTQVTVNDQLSPIYYVGGNQINFLVPNEAPTSGSATVQVIRASTGQILGSNTIAVAAASPGLFTETATGSGQVAALNQDGTVNGPMHPAPWGSIVAFFGTGVGLVPGAPADGVAAGGQTPTSSTPQVAIGAAFVPPANVTYSGLAPGLVGVWQVNVMIPNTVPPTTSSAPTPVFFLLDAIPTGGPAVGRPTTMWVKQP